MPPAPEEIIQGEQTVAYDPETQILKTSPSTPMRTILADDPGLPARPALSRDPHARIWRLAFDIGYPSAEISLQRWSNHAIPDLVELNQNVGILHERDHDLQPSRAIYPGEGTVLFFYSGTGSQQRLHVSRQRCQRL